MTNFPKTLLFSLLLMLVPLCSMAEEEHQQKFSPEKYQQELEQFITTEAALTPQECAKFFPLYRELQAKQRAIYDKMKANSKQKPQTEEACKKAIQQRDEMELEQKKIQQTYHQKFLTVLPASKVFDVIKAEDRFHRRMFKNWGKGEKRPQQKK